MVTSASVTAAEVLCSQLMAPSVSVPLASYLDLMESASLTWSVAWMMIVLTSSIVNYQTTLVVILVSSGHVERMPMVLQEATDVSADVLKDTLEILTLVAVSDIYIYESTTV